MKVALSRTSSHAHGATSRPLPFAGFFIIVLSLITFIAFAPRAEAQTITPSSVVALTNSDRLENGISSLTEDMLLEKAAQKKAEDMAKNGYFSHWTPDGRSPWSFMTSVGYYYLRAGENIAVDFSDASTLNTAWMNSPLHRANILDGRYTKIGIGIAYGMRDGHSTTYVVQFFAKPAPVAVKKPATIAFAK